MNAQHEHTPPPIPRTLETRFLCWREAEEAHRDGRICPVCHHRGPCRCADRMAAEILPALWDRYVDLAGSVGPSTRDRLREGWAVREVPQP